MAAWTAMRGGECEVADSAGDGGASGKVGIAAVVVIGPRDAEKKTKCGSLVLRWE